MDAEDKKHLESGEFDREAWSDLWDRMPPRVRPSTVRFVLQKLHAIESGGRWKMSWHYETNEQRESSDGPVFEGDQPGDVITFKGSLQVGNRSTSHVRCCGDMSKRTHASVTEEPCTCGYLSNAADDLQNPIRFDVQTAEYQFVYGEQMLVIYHCPFCGGAAPESKRSLLFAQIPDTEEERLTRLLDGIETIDQAVSKFGLPDFDDISKTRQCEHEDQPPRIQHHRDIRYYKLSDVADIWITERPDGKIFWQLQGKYIGQKAGDTAP